jgi:Na+/H+ antiporter NhaD/arsenite permease-like protein
VTEKIDRMVAALLGGMAMIIFVGSYTQEEAFHHVDFNVIFLLAGMMLIAGVISETGLFQWLAVRAVQIGKGNPIRIMQILAIVTAVGSALLDNVTVVVLIAPVTLFVASSLGVNPLPFLIAEVIASNIGGAATLIGDPPNIIIGSAAGIDFVTFMLNMGPIVIVCLIFYILLLPLLFRKQVPSTEQANSIEHLDATGLISNPVLLRQSLIVLGGVLLGFMLHGTFHLDTATVALTGAAVLLLWSRRDPHKALEDVEWGTLLFFVGLFIMVEGLVAVGAIDMAANWLLEATGGDLKVTAMAILWISAIASGIIDNIPYTATMVPLIQNLGERGMDTWPLWWALAMGADFGGNATLVGASANVVVASFAARSGHHISFMKFLGYGLIVTFVTLLFSTVYLWVRYLM